MVIESLLPTTCGTSPPGEMSSTTSATGMPGLQVSGQLETRSRRLLSTMEKLAPGLVAPAAAMIHSPSGSIARVRSTASARVSWVDHVVSAGEAVAATLVRQVAAES